VTDRVIRRIQRSVEAARATHSAAHSAGMSVGFPRVTLYCDDVERLILMADSKTQDLNEKDERIRELEDEIEDVRRDAENSEEQLGYMMDLQTQVNALFDAVGIPGHESLTASDTIEYAVEHLSHEKAQRERIRELEAENALSLEAMGRASAAVDMLKARADKAEAGLVKATNALVELGLRIAELEDKS